MHNIEVAGNGTAWVGIARRQPEVSGAHQGIQILCLAARHGLVSRKLALWIHPPIFFRNSPDMKLAHAMTLLLCLSLLAADARKPSTREANSTDWPGWRGPDRTGICPETGLLTSWPENGPRLLWKAGGAGEGLSTPSIAGNLIYLMGNRDGQEWVVAMDRTQEGKEVWKTALGAVRHGGSGYPGPRSTPTVDGDRVYALGLNGDLACLEAKSGNVVWKRDLVGDFGGSTPGWGYSESVLVDGPWVVCTPGGAKSTMLALKKDDGAPVWQSEIGDPAGYASIVVTTVDGVKQYVTFTMRGVISVRAEDGKLAWRYDRPASGTANIATPIAHDNKVFASAGYGMGSGLVTLEQQDGKFVANESYFSVGLKNRTGGCVLVDDYVYGSDENGILVCLNYATGEEKWKERLGICSLLYADGMLFARDEGGRMNLVKASPDKFEKLASFDQPDRSGATAYPHPVIADGKLYLRDQDMVFCYDVRGDGQ